MPKLLIGIILTSGNYSPEIQSYCRGFNEQAITQPTIIITRTIKHDGYSLVKCSHMWRPHIFLGTLSDWWTQKRGWGTDSEPRAQGGRRGTAGSVRHAFRYCTILNGQSRIQYSGIQFDHTQQLIPITPKCVCKFLSVLLPSLFFINSFLLALFEWLPQYDAWL